MEEDQFISKTNNEYQEILVDYYQFIIAHYKCEFYSYSAIF